MIMEFARRYNLSLREAGAPDNAMTHANKKNGDKIPSFVIPLRQ